MAGNVLESLVIRMTADVTEGVRGITRINNQLDRVANLAGRAGTAVKVLGAGLSGRAFINYSKGMVQAGVETQRFADQIGSTVEEMSHLRLLSAQVGMSTEEFNSGIVTLIKNTEGAIDGLGEFARQFRKMGIDAKKFQKLGLAEQIAVIGHALRDFDDDAKTAIALRLFEKPGIKMIRLYEQFGDTLTDVEGNLKKVLTSDVSRPMEEYQKTMERVSQRTQIATQKMIATQLPLLETLAVAWEKFVDRVTPAATKFGKVIANQVKETGAQLKVLGDEIGLMFAIGGALKRGEFAGAAELLGELVNWDPAKRVKEAMEDVEKEIEKSNKEIDKKFKEVRAPIVEPDEHVKAYREMIAGVKKDVKAFEQELKDTGATIGMTDRELDLAVLTVGKLARQIDLLGSEADETRERLTKLKEANRYKQAIVDIKEFVDQQQRQLDLMNPLLDATERFWKVNKDVDDILKEIGLSSKANEVRFRNQLEQQERLRDHIKKTNEEVEAAKDVGREVGEVFASAFEEAIVSGQRFQDFLEDLANDLLRLGTRELISKPLIEAFGDFAGGVSGKGGGSAEKNWITQMGSFFGSLFNFKQHGGMTRIGEPTIVGEMGPEAFIPTASGIVIPNNQLAGLGGDTVINMTVNARDADSFRQSQSQIMADISRMSKNASRRMK